jgi:hypothetical protein
VQTASLSETSCEPLASWRRRTSRANRRLVGDGELVGERVEGCVTFVLKVDR